MSVVCSADWEWWLRLILVPGISLATQRRLLALAGPPDVALRLPERTLAPLIGEAHARTLLAGPDRRLMGRSLAWLSQAGHSLLTLSDAAYPKALLEIADPPLALFASGNLGLMARRGIAVVGSRNATRQGLEDAFNFSASLSRSGLCIVSGLALGVDGAAHRGGLAGAGGSIAVLGNGPDRIYPAAHEGLARQLENVGLLLSEHAPGAAPRAHHFPRRNRLISGLSEGVLVIEAAERSGSLVTARQALEQGRDVFALPGSIHSPLARGCHALIKQGAALVEAPADVLSELGVTARPSPVPTEPSQNNDDELGFLDAAPTSVDTLVARSGHSTQAVLAKLAQLEIAGSIERLAGGLYRRLKRQPQPRGIE